MKAAWTPEAYDRGAYIGMTGSGKSFELKEDVGCWQAAAQDCAVFDVHDEYSPLGRKRRNLRLGPCRQRIEVPDFLRLSGREREDLLCQRPLSVAFVPQIGALAERQRLVAEQFAELAPFVEARGELIFICEEAGVWALATEAARASLDALATGAGKEGVALVVGAQFLTQIPEGTRGQITHYSCGVMVKAAHLDLLARETNRAFADQVSRLQRRERLRFDVLAQGARRRDKEEQREAA